MTQKKYIAPEATVYHLTTHLLNTISDPTRTNVDGLGVSDQYYEDTGRSRRHRSVWDDQEEEEEEL